MRLISMMSKKQKNLSIKNANDIYSNLPRFIEYTFQNRNFLKFNWVEFVNNWVDKNVPIIKYENLLNDAPKELKHSLIFYKIQPPSQRELQEIVAKYSFKNLSERVAGDENNNSFLRKGIAGDWKTNFSSEAKKVFNYYAGDTLLKLEYEKDDSWILN